MVNFKNGYSKIDNDILVKIMETKLTANQLKILICIIRATYGFNKKSYDLSLSYISEQTKISKSNVSKTLKNLIDRKILVIYQNETNNKPKNIGINSRISDWIDVLSCQSNNPTLSCQSNNSGVVKSDDLELLNQQPKNTYKNTYKKSYIHQPPLMDKYEGPFLEFWDMYPKRREKVKCYEYCVENGLIEKMDEIIDGLKIAIAEDYSTKELQYIPYPMKFLVDEQWKDYLKHDGEDIKREEAIKKQEEQKEYLRSMGVDV